MKETHGALDERYEETIDYFLSLVMDVCPPASAPDCVEKQENAAKLKGILTVVRDALQRAQSGNFSFYVPFQGALPQYLKTLQIKMGQVLKMIKYIADGDMDQRLGFDGPLARAFNGMSENLALLVEDLSARQFELEAIREQLEYEGHQREIAEFKLKEEEERWRLALECGRDGLWDVDLSESSKEPFYSQKLLDLLKVSDPEDIPSPSLWHTFSHPDDASVAEILRTRLSGENGADSFNLEFRIRCGDGVYRWFHFEGLVFRDPETERPVRSIGLVADIQERKEREALISHKATHDTLTGLPNRALFNDYLNNMLIAAQQKEMFLAVVMVDLDKFKQVNDTLGHHAGDILLVEVGKRLSGSTREGDVVARLGGDEFAMLLPFRGSDKKVIAASIERIMNSLRKNVMLETVDYQITASMGVAVYPPDGSDPLGLLKRADEALYWAKHAGRNEFAFWEAERVAPEAP